MNQMGDRNSWLDKWGACKVCGGEIPYGHDPECDVQKLQEAVDDLREALNAMKHADGCFCEASFSMCDGSHPSHTPECKRALDALAKPQ